MVLASAESQGRGQAAEPQGPTEQRPGDREVGRGETEAGRGGREGRGKRDGEAEMGEACRDRDRRAQSRLGIRGHMQTEWWP